MSVDPFDREMTAIALREVSEDECGRAIQGLMML